MPDMEHKPLWDIYLWEQSLLAMQAPWSSGKPRDLRRGQALLPQVWFTQQDVLVDLYFDEAHRSNPTSPNAIPTNPANIPPALMNTCG